MSFSSRHAEHFWIFDDVKADFEGFRVPQGGIRFLKPCGRSMAAAHHTLDLVCMWEALC
jgi:hypothetical protein